MRKLLLSVFVTILGLATPAFADRIVIVHGAFQTAEAWSAVTTLLKAKGHDVEVVNLPGRDAVGDMKAIALSDYRDAALAVIRAKPEPVYLVGHSFGGITIAATGDAAPAAIRKLIFLAAYVPRDGESLQSLAAQDKGNKFTQQNFVIAPDYSYAEVLASDRGLIFANDGDEATQARTAGAMVREPLKPMGEAISLSPAFESWQRPTSARRATNAVSPMLQDMMNARAGLTQIVPARYRAHALS